MGTAPAVQLDQVHYYIFSTVSGIFLVHPEEHSSPPTPKDLRHKFGNGQELPILLTGGVLVLGSCQVNSMDIGCFLTQVSSSGP